MAVNEVCISEDIPRLDSSGETNRFEKCEAHFVDSLSKGLQVGDCWDVKTIEQTRPYVHDRDSTSTYLQTLDTQG